MARVEPGGQVTQPVRSAAMEALAAQVQRAPVWAVPLVQQQHQDVAAWVAAVVEARVRSRAEVCAEPDVATEAAVQAAARAGPEVERLQSAA